MVPFAHLALGLLAAAPIAYEYRTPDGVDHFVGDLSDVPATDRARARPVDVSGVPLNRQAEEGIEHASAQAADERAQVREPARPLEAHRLPGVPWFAGAAALLGAVAYLLHRLYRRRYMGNDRVWRAARVSTWLAGLAVVLVAVRLALPHLGRWHEQLARFGLDALIEEEDRNSEALHRGIQKAEMKSLGLDDPDGAGAPKRPPPRPFWSGAPPPDGLLHR